jgi:hypothetical protein
MVPENCMSGQLWDWEPATKAEWNEFLGSLLPSRDNVGEDELGVDVFEKHCGKRVLWIPKRPDAIEDSFRDTYRNMLERMSGGPGLGECGQMTNAKYLSGLLQVVAPERDRGAALEFLRGGAEYRDYIYVAVLTKKWLLMIRVPRDQVRPSIIVPACPGTP